MPRIIASICFILSGAASISYQMIWLRDAISYFGVITPVISILLSVFMLGLTIGTSLAGYISKSLSVRNTLICYMTVELSIAILAINVPHLFAIGYNFLLVDKSLGSIPYLFFSALIIVISLLPTCILIGTTFPLMIRILEHNKQNQKNFGMLYFANLIGAFIGCISPLLLIELTGVKAALQLTTLFNLSAFLIAAGFLYITFKDSYITNSTFLIETDNKKDIAGKYKAFLFLTGFVAIGSELLWIKAFTPVIGSSVYAFALVLGIYLYANILGNLFYLKKVSDTNFLLALILLPFCALLIIFSVSMWSLSHFVFLMIISIIPISFIFGYITPNIIDNSCESKPNLVAKAYSYNFAGCILGPLFTGYILFPLYGLKISLLLQAIILSSSVMLLLYNMSLQKKLIFSMLLFAATGFAFKTVSYEDFKEKNGVIYRDWIGYIAATGEGMYKKLTVNGIGMTNLTTITKNMINLPTEHHENPHKVLIICMGMGTTLHTAVNWPFDSITIVELSHAVAKTFKYFHEDAQSVLDDKRVKLVIDDGRRFLLRNKEKYDIITIDPPPPLEASGSGLLYSADFMSIISSRLNEKGILAHWIPDDENTFVTKRIIAAITNNFKYIKIFKSVEGWGMHILASNSPITTIEKQAYINKLPTKVKTDLMEYHPNETLGNIVSKSLKEVDVENVTPKQPDLIAPLSDNWLYNEFFILRKLGYINQN